MWFDRLVQGALDTLLMVGVSSLIALLVGIPLAVFLVTSDKGGIFQAPTLNRALGAFVNLFRSIPFLILMVALLPFTRLIVGTTYGVWAAVVPLNIAAITSSCASISAGAVKRPLGTPTRRPGRVVTSGTMRAAGRPLRAMMISACAPVSTAST